MMFSSISFTPNVNPKILPIRVNPKRRTSTQAETVLRLLPFRVQSWAGGSEEILRHHRSFLELRPTSHISAKMETGL